jgi:hypothetical protein
MIRLRHKGKEPKMTNRTNRSWTNTGPGIFVSNDGVRIVRTEEGYDIEFPEDHVPGGWALTLESAMLDADALEYTVDANGKWSVA